jgi:hypothetical protein
MGIFTPIDKASNPHHQPADNRIEQEPRDIFRDWLASLRAERPQGAPDLFRRMRHHPLDDEGTHGGGRFDHCLAAPFARRL